MEERLLKYFRNKIGSYCCDEYWIATIRIIFKNQEHPIKFIHDNLNWLAMRAIATDSSSRI